MEALPGKGVKFPQRSFQAGTVGSGIGRGLKKGFHIEGTGSGQKKAQVAAGDAHIVLFGADSLVQEILHVGGEEVGAGPFGHLDSLPKG